MQVDADVVDASGVVGGDLVHFALGHAAVSGYRDRDLVCVSGALDASFGGFEEGHGIDGDIDDVFDDDLIGVGDDAEDVYGDALSRGRREKRAEGHRDVML